MEKEKMLKSNNNDNPENKTDVEQKIKEIETNYWLLNNKLKKNSFYLMLEALRDEITKEFKYDYILSIDFGHGETAVYLLKWKRNEPEKTTFLGRWIRKSMDVPEIHVSELDSKMKSLKLTQKSTVIPTRIAFTDKGETVIGEIYDKSQNFVQNFKIPPLEWKQSQYQIGDDEKTYEEITKRFFSQVYQNIIKYNGEEGKRIDQARKNGRLLICLGCPASERWTSVAAMETYKNLVSAATNTSSKNISIVPESTAALMSVMLRKNDKGSENTKIIRLENGVAVFDFGSSTIDFTFILPGNRIITKSLKTGGHTIDRLIFKVALRELGISKDDITDNELEHILILIRNTKEAFYTPEGNPETNEILICGKKININREFFAKVWEEMLDKENETFLDYCEDFIKNCYLTIKNAVGNCGDVKVILAGGTSNVTELRTRVKKVFGSKNIIDDDELKTPSLCVAKGLCAMKNIEIEGIGHLDQYRESTERYINKEYKLIIKAISDYIADITVKELGNIFADLIQKNNPVPVKAFCDIIENRLKKSHLPTDGIYEAINNGIKRYNEHIIYPSCIISEKIYDEKYLFSFNLPDYHNVTGISDLVAYNLIHNNLISELVVNDLMANTLLIAAVVACLGLGVGYLSFALLLYRKEAKKIILKTAERFDTTISPEKLSKIADNVSKKKFRNDLSHEISKELKHMHVSESEIKNQFEINAEAHLGKIMLYVYDSKPES